MTRIRNVVMAGALAFASVIPMSVAEAGPIAPAPIKIEKNSDVTQVRCGRWGCGRGHWRGRGYWRGRYWGPRRVWIAPRVVIRPGPAYVVRGGYNAHVRWCLNRYGSYNPRTNTFLSYDGYYKRCNSPYR